MERDMVYRVWFHREGLGGNPQGKVSVLAVNCATESPHSAQISLEEARSLLKLNLGEYEVEWRLRALIEGEPIEGLRFSRNQLQRYGFDPRIVAELG